MTYWRKVRHGEESDPWWISKYLKIPSFDLGRSGLRHGLHVIDHFGVSHQHWTMMLSDVAFHSSSMQDLPDIIDRQRLAHISYKHCVRALGTCGKAVDLSSMLDANSRNTVSIAVSALWPPPRAFHQTARPVQKRDQAIIATREQQPPLSCSKERPMIVKQGLSSPQNISIALNEQPYMAYIEEPQNPSIHDSDGILLGASLQKSVI